MEYLSVQEARELGGLRVALTAGVPGPWGEALKYVLQHKGIHFHAVEQLAGEENLELQEWTGHANAPTCIYEDEPPRVSWLDQLLLAERLAPDPGLLPADREQRALVIGLCHEIAGEGGLGWQRRLQLLAPVMLSDSVSEGMLRMAERYAWSEEAYGHSNETVADILRCFLARLEQQAVEQSDYLVGGALTAVDLYLASFLGMLSPLPDSLNPMPAQLRQVYSTSTPEEQQLLGSGLLAYRDRIFERHIRTPLDF